MGIAVGTADAHSTAAAGGSGAAATTMRPAVHPATPKPTLTITNDYSDCGSGTGLSSGDVSTYTESYFATGQYLSNYQLGCVFDTSSGSEATTQIDGCNAGAPDATMGGDAQFEDGQNALVCGEPDVTASGNSDANSNDYYDYLEGDYCKATVLTGSKGTTESKIVTYDEALWYQPYTDYDGTYVNSVTNVCVGSVPSTKGIASSAVFKKVSCSEMDPYTGKTIKGLGETATYPDREFEEICNIPNAKT